VIRDDIPAFPKNGEYIVRGTDGGKQAVTRTYSVAGINLRDGTSAAGAGVAPDTGGHPPGYVDALLKTRF
jgi:hypothetical protein